MRCLLMVLMVLISMCSSAVPARWISGDSSAPEKPAPILYKKFVLVSKPTNGVFSIAVAGWCEVRVNGEKVGRDVLQPITC